MAPASQMRRACLLQVSHRVKPGRVMRSQTMQDRDKAMEAT
jgi:hypothetical protein